jgi:hypothetical protein
VGFPIRTSNANRAQRSSSVTPAARGRQPEWVTLCRRQHTPGTGVLQIYYTFDHSSHILRAVIASSIQVQTRHVYCYTLFNSDIKTRSVRRSARTFE